jgi:helicase
MGQVVCRHFLAPDQAFTMLDGIRKGRSPDQLVADIELMDEH